MRSILIAFGFFLAMLANDALAASPDPASLVKAELVSETVAVVPGRPFWVGVRLVIKPLWHVYWRNPGDSGLAPEIVWRLPAGFVADSVLWPTPSRIDVGPLANYGYEGEAVLLARITPPATLARNDRVELAADVSYLMCEHECIPGEAHLTLSAPAALPGEDDRPDNAVAELFVKTRARLPQTSPWRATHHVGAESVTLNLVGPPLSSAERIAVQFFPYSDSLIVHAAEQRLKTRPDGISLVMRRSALATKPPGDVDGVLMVEEDADGAHAVRAFEIKSKPAGGAAASENAHEDSPAVGASFLAALGLALLGGLILNLMPCVFPVLSIKALHLAKHANESPARMRLQGLAYAAGVLVSFGALGSALYAARTVGEEIGWGFQLQSPIFVGLLAYGFFAMGLSLSGVAHFGHSLAGVEGWTTPRHGLVGSFATGLVAVMVAAPCTAPFMGTALGFAMTQPLRSGLLVFFALGLGLALPFLALSFVPGLRRLLPRPGAWMETLQQVLAFPLYGTVVWLIWVLSRQVGSTGMLAALAGLVVTGFAVWAVSLAQRSEGRALIVVRTAAVAALIALVSLIRAVGADSTANGTATQVVGAQVGAPEPFSQARLDALLDQDRVVFVNMTAAWCITCLVNERVALSTDAVKNLFRDHDVAYLKGDWTNRNPEIARVLKRYGRNGVPLYLVYVRGQQPIVLPQILTESIVIEAIAQYVPERLQSKGA